MNQTNNKNGFVYILGVKDITLPVSKIGMTTRTPYERCSELNSGSTGDFLWEVEHYLSVDDCVTFEKLLHQKLSPLRQKRREFFNLTPDDAKIAMFSILEAQSEINVIDIPLESVHLPSTITDKKKGKGKSLAHTFSKDAAQYADLFQTFSSILGVKGRPFGQLSSPNFGISDGEVGIQWNLAVNKESGLIRLGVNLEGTEKTGKWLIAPFVLSEPNVEKLKAVVKNPNEIFLKFTKDAWQGAGRLNIKDQYLGGKEPNLSNIDQLSWVEILEEAKTCLDEQKNYRGRKKKQPVVLQSTGEVIYKDISPHLTVWTKLNLYDDNEEHLRQKFAELQPVFDWVAKGTQG